MSTIASNFILNSDYATLKNDNGTTTTVVIPGSSVVPGNGSSEFHTDVTIGVAGSINRLQISRSKDSSKRYATKALVANYTGSLGPYNIIAYMTRTSVTTARCSLLLLNPYSSNMTTESGSETYTFYIDTFLPPFN